MWIPIDTRLPDHPKVRRMASSLNCSRWEVVGALVQLWGLAADLDTEQLDGMPSDIEAEYDLPRGLLGSLAQVGWATFEERGVTLSTRNSERDEAKARRREQAQHAAHMRWHGQHDAAAMLGNATDRQTLQRKKQTKRASAASPPPALEGAGGDVRASVALRAALNGLGAAPPPPNHDPVARLKALQSAAAAPPAEPAD